MAALCCLGEYSKMADSINNIGGVELDWETIRPAYLRLYLEALRRAIVEKHRLSDYQNTLYVGRCDINPLWKQPFPPLTSLYLILYNTLNPLSYYGRDIFEYLWRRFADYRTADSEGGWHNSATPPPAWTRASILDAIGQDEFIYPVQCLDYVESGTSQGYAESFKPRHPQPLYDWIKQSYKILNLLKWFRRPFGFLDYDQPQRRFFYKQVTAPPNEIVNTWNSTPWYAGGESQGVGAYSWFNGTNSVAQRIYFDAYLPMKWDNGDGERIELPVDTYIKISHYDSIRFDNELGVDWGHYYRIPTTVLSTLAYDRDAPFNSETGAQQVVSEFGKIESIPRFYNMQYPPYAWSGDSSFGTIFIVKMDGEGGFQYGNWETNAGE